MEATMAKVANKKQAGKKAAGSAEQPQRYLYVSAPEFADLVRSLGMEGRLDGLVEALNASRSKVVLNPSTMKAIYGLRSKDARKAPPAGMATALATAKAKKTEKPKIILPEPYKIP
jgi:hypothetical protein